jgi:hypothetical protein
MKNKLTDLRNHLFETIESLKDTDTPMDVARGKVIANVAQAIINSAKVELDFLQLTGQEARSTFLSLPDPSAAAADVSTGPPNNAKGKK